MKIADFRIQTSAPDAPGAGVIGLYADASGRLVTKDANSVIRSIGNFVTGSLTTGVAQTGTLVFGTNNGLTGIVFGNSTPTNNILLSTPVAWIPVTGPNQQAWVVPAYSIKNT